MCNLHGDRLILRRWIFVYGVYRALGTAGGGRVILFEYDVILRNLDLGWRDLVSLRRHVCS